MSVLMIATVSLDCKNLFAYSENNPITSKDSTGNVVETVFDLISLGSSIVEVIAQPNNPWNWICMIGDIADLIPCVTGLGETLKGIKASVKGLSKAKKASNAVEAGGEVAEVLSKADIDINPQSPMFGDDWHKYFNETYGQNNVIRESASIDELVDMPSKITNYSPQQVANLAEANGWAVGPLGKGSLSGIPYKDGGGFSMHAPNGGSAYIQFHPGGGHHGEFPYFKVSSGPNGIARYFIGGN